MVINSLLIMAGIAAIGIIKIITDMCKTPNARNNINIEHEIPPKYEALVMDDNPPNYS